MYESQMQIKLDFFDRLSWSTITVLPAVLLPGFSSEVFPEGKLVSIRETNL